MPRHPLLPATDHDEQARQDFVASLRSHLAAHVAPGNKAIYQHRVKPKFAAAEQREPADYHEIGKLMTRDSYYQFWSAMQRRSQELMWDSVIDPTERQLSELISTSEALAARKPAGGSLRLDSELPMPRYHTAADIHIQPGGYHGEVAPNDITAGVLYEGGLPIYINDALGVRSDGLGRTLARYTQLSWADWAPKTILDMGCAVGNSTLPWAEFYPQARIDAIDVAAPCLRYAHARAEHYGVAVHFSQQNAEQTNFQSASYDLIVSHIVLHETSHSALPNILRECWRLLRPGGRMLHMEVPRGDNAFEQFMLQWEAYNNNESFSRYMTDIDLVALARKTGFPADNTWVAQVDAGLSEEQSNYTETGFCWPVLVGEKPVS